MSLGAPGGVSVSSESLDSMDSSGQDSDVYVAPEAAVTNVLVIGATGRYPPLQTISTVFLPGQEPKEYVLQGG